ncbi:MAG: hypothetical protein PHT33_13505 [bacterium]|nr:hypothetical protein [bacterium]
MKKHKIVVWAILVGVLCLCLKAYAATNVYVIPAISDSRILPNTVLSAFISRNISITACRGEYESASFVIKSDVNSSGVAATVTDLVRQGGIETIPGTSVDVRVVKCWYQAGYKLYDMTHKNLVPELLLKDDSLIQVDLVEQKNYVRFDTPTPRTVCISDPSPDPPLFTTIDGFPIRDSATLQPVNLEADKNKQFWVTIHVPDTAVTGTYIGNIDIIGPGVAATVKVKVVVPEIELSAPTLDYSMYYQLGYLSSTGSISCGSKNEEQFRAEMRDLVSHGVTAPALYAQTNLGDALTICSEEGINIENLYYLGLFINSYGDDLTALSTAVSNLANNVAGYGVNQLYIYGIDESSMDNNQNRAQIGAVHAAGGKVFCAQTAVLAASVVDVLDLANTHSAPNKQLADLYHGEGHKIFSYANPQGGEETPEVYRRNFGLLLHRNGYDGTMDYAYQAAFGHVWNDWEHSSYRDHCCC